MNTPTSPKVRKARARAPIARPPATPGSAVIVEQLGAGLCCEPLTLLRAGVRTGQTFCGLPAGHEGDEHEATWKETSERHHRRRFARGASHELEPVLVHPEPPPAPPPPDRRHGRSIVCDACTAGWMRLPGERVDRCTICRGTGWISVRRLAELLDEPRSTVRKLLGERPMRASVAARVCKRLLALHSPKQPRLV